MFAPYYVTMDTSWLVSCQRVSNMLRLCGLRDWLTFELADLTSANFLWV